MKRRTMFTVLGIIVSMTLTLGTALAGSNSTTLPNGANLTVSVDDPVTSTEFLIPAGDATRDITVSGTASVGEGDPDVTLVYVMDVSFSTQDASGGDCGGDRNGDGNSNSILDCQIAAVLNLNTAAIAGGSVDEVGFVVYGQGGAAADMTPGGGDDPITAPDANGDVPTVVNSVYAVAVDPAPACDGGVGQFTNKNVGCDGTDFAAGLAAATAVVNASSNGTNIVIFLSDGLSNQEDAPGFNANLTALAATGAVAYTFAVGAGSSCTGGDFGTLQQIADATGGTCAAVTDPTALSNILPDLISTTLDALAIEVNGGGATSISNDDITPDLPQDGPVSVDYTTIVGSLGPGDHEICVTASGSDTSGSDSVTQCETIHLYQLTLEPDGVVNELGTSGQTHVVTATLLGPTSGLAPVAGRTIEFEVVSGPNAGQSDTAVTDSDGVASFTYAATQGLAGLGTDTIEACITLNDPTGETGCVQVTKEWADTTPPEVACVPTVNPHGQTIPGAPGRGGQGQNQDGFYELTATDAVDPDPQIYLQDTGSGTVFGPFASGTRIKYTESNAPPDQKTMGSGNGQAGAVDWHINGTGDAAIYAVDFSGNTSDPVMCLVPPPQ